MELPHLGEQCSEVSCKQLDFLPMKCNACSCIFCKDHLFYSKHSCPKGHLKDIQVPVCPLCECPVPIRKERGESASDPDLVISRHIDDDCQSDRALTRRNKKNASSNRCSLKKCKGKELIPLKCDDCGKNFCLKHRHTADHQCEGAAASRRSMAAAAAARRSNATTTTNGKPVASIFNINPSRSSASNSQSQGSRIRPNTNKSRELQGQLNEDGALARALQESLNSGGEQQPQMTQEEMDRQTALALQRSMQEEERRRRGQQNSSSSSSNQNNCSMS